MALPASRAALLLLLAFAAPVLAQPRAGIVEVSAVRSMPVAPAQARFGITVSSPVDVGLAQVTGAFQEIGLKQEDLTSVSVSQRFRETGFWMVRQFDLVVPYARMDSVTSVLDRLMAEPPKSIEFFSFQAQAEPSAAAVEETRRRLLPELFEEARAGAERQLAAAGQSPGPILYLADDATYGYGSTSVTWRLFLRMGVLGGTPAPRRVAVRVRERPQAGAFDIAQMNISVSLSGEQTQSAAVELLKPLGVTAEDMTGQAYRSQPGAGFGLGTLPREPALRDFSFAVTRPAASLIGFLNQAAALAGQRARPQISVRATLSNSLAVLERERQRALPSLLESAKRRAQPLADLLGLPLRSPQVLASSASPFPNLPGATSGLAFVLVSPDLQAGWPGLAVEFSLE